MNKWLWVYESNIFELSKWCSLLRRSLNHMDHTEKEVLLVVYLGSWGLSNYWRLYNVLHIAVIYTHHLKVNNKHVDIVIIIKLENSSTHCWISIELQKQHRFTRLFHFFQVLFRKSEVKRWFHVLMFVFGLFFKILLGILLMISWADV